MTTFYNENFFIPLNTKPRNFPEYTKLRDIQYQPWQSETSGLIPSTNLDDISNPINWSLLPQERDITDAEGRALGDLVQLSTNAVLNNSWTGYGKDPSKALFLRTLLDQEPLTEIQVSDTEVNSVGINKRQEQLKRIAESTPEILNLPETKKQALQLKQELNYIHRKQNQVKTKYSEFNTADFYRGQEGILGGVIQKLIANAYDVTNNRVFNLGLDVISSVDDVLGTSLVPDSVKEMVVRPSTSTSDVENLVSRFDETFNYNRWFEDTVTKNDSFVAAGLLNAGISNETFALARNADHAHLMLANKLLSNHVDKRLSKYHPSSFQNLLNFSTSMAQGIYNAGADIAVEAGAELAITGLLSLVPEPSTKVAAGVTAGRLATKAARLGNIFRRSFETTTYLAGVGDLPRYALSWGLLRRTGISFIPGAVGGGAVSILGQNSDIALANALYHYNPDMKSDFSWDEVVNTAAISGAVSASLGLISRIPGVSKTWSRNRQIKDMFYSAGFAPPKNLLQPYPWEITARNISSVFNRKPKVITEDPLLKTINESLLQGTEPSLEQQNADARANAEAVSASRVIDNVENTTSIPEDLKIQRQDTEAPEQFINRFIFSSKTWDESSLTVLLDGLSPNKNFSKLTTREQFAVLLELEDFDISTALDKVIGDKRNETSLSDAEKETLDFLEKVVHTGLKKDLLDKSFGVIKKLSEQDQADVRKARAEGKPIGTRSVSSAKDLARSIFDSAVDSTVTGTTTPPKVSETKPTETDATVKTAEVTQEKINQVTEDAKEEIKASTAEELENNTENIQDNIRHKLFGGIEPKTNLKRLAATRQKKLGLSPEKQKKVLQVLQNPTNFLKLAQGNTDYISDFFERISSAELGYSKESVRIILAATVNLNWNSSAARKISQLNIVEAGKRSKVNALTGDISVESKTDDIVNLLHEIGHVFGLFDYSATAQKIALQTNRSLIDLHVAALGLDKVKDQTTLRYFTANPDELYAQAFATLMLDRVRLSVFMKEASAKSPAIIKALQKTFEVVVESLLNIIDTLNLDKVYNESTLLETIKRGIESIEKSADPILTQHQYFRLVVNDLIETIKNKKVNLNNIVEITDLANKLNSTIEEEIKKTIKKDPRFKTRKLDKRMGDAIIPQKFLFDSNELYTLIGFIKQLGVSNRIELNIVVDAFIQTKIQGLSTDNVSRFNEVFLENLKTNQTVFNTVVFNFLKDMAALGNKEARELNLTSIPVGKEEEIYKLLSTKINESSEVAAGDDLVARPTFRFATLDETISYFQKRQTAKKRAVKKITQSTLFAPPRTPGDGSFLVEAVSEKKPLSSLHWYDFEGSEYSKEQFLKDVQETTQRMPEGVRHLMVERQDTPEGETLDAYWFDENAAKAVLEKYGVQGTVESFVRRSADETFLGQEKVAIDELFGPQTEGKVSPELDAYEFDVQELFFNRRFSNKVFEILGISNIWKQNVVNTFSWSFKETEMEYKFVGEEVLWDEEGQDTTFETWSENKKLNYELEHFWDDVKLYDKNKPENVEKILVEIPDETSGVTAYRAYFVDITKAKQILEKFGIKKSVVEFLTEVTVNVPEGNAKKAYDKLVPPKSLKTKNLIFKPTKKQLQQTIEKFQEYANKTNRYDLEGFAEYVGTKQDGERKTTLDQLSPNWMNISLTEKQKEQLLLEELDDTGSGDELYAPPRESGKDLTPIATLQEEVDMRTDLSMSKFEKELLSLGINTKNYEAYYREVSPDKKATKQNRTVIQTDILNLIIADIQAGKLTVKETISGKYIIKKATVIETERNPVVVQKIKKTIKESTEVLTPESPVTVETVNAWFTSSRPIQLVGKKILRIDFEKAVDQTLEKIKKSKFTLDEQGKIVGIKDSESFKTIEDLEKLFQKSVDNQYKTILKQLSGSSRAGLTGKNWRAFIDRRNEGIPEDKQLRSEKNETDEQWLVTEKKRYSQLYREFEKEFKSTAALSSLTTVKDESGTLTVVSSVEEKEKETSYKTARNTRWSELINILDPESKTVFKNKISKVEQKDKWIWERLRKDKSTKEILEEAIDPSVIKKIGVINEKEIENALNRVIKNIKQLFKKLHGKDLDGLTEVEEEVFIAEYLKNKDKVPDPEPATREEVIQEAIRETEEREQQLTLFETVNETDLNKPTENPIVSVPNATEDVTVVIHDEGTIPTVTPLTPHVNPKIGEQVAKKLKKQIITTAPTKQINWTTADRTKYDAATGIVKNKFYFNLKIIQGVLGSLPEELLQDINIAELLPGFEKLFAERQEKEAVKIFLSLMKQLNIEGVKVVSSKTGKTVYKFIWDTAEWSYGGITIPGIKTTTSSKPKVAETVKPEVTETVKPEVTKPTTPKVVETVKPEVTPTQKAPNNKDVPIIQRTEKQPKTIPSSLPEVSESDRVFIHMSENNEAMRDNGTDVSSFVGLLKKYLRSLSEQDKKTLRGRVPNDFKELYLELVDINSRIMLYNRNLFEDELVVQRFWKAVDSILTKEDSADVRLNLRVRKTLKQVYAEAAEKVSTSTKKFVSPLSHETIIFSNKKIKLGSVDKVTQGVINGTLQVKAPEKPIKTEVPKLLPSEKKAIEQPKVEEEVQTKKQKLTNDALIDNMLDVVNNNASHLLRQNNWVSFIFGGDERYNRNWWRAAMSGTVNFIQRAQSQGTTIRSLDRTVRFLSMLMDNSRTMTGHLVAPNAKPIRSFNAAYTESFATLANLTRVHRLLDKEAVKLGLNKEQRTALLKLQWQTWTKKTSPSVKELRDSLGFDKDYKTLETILDKYRKQLIYINKEILELEDRTEWRAVIDKNGNSVDSDVYLPIQIKAAVLNEIKINQELYKKLIDSLVLTRTASKLKDDVLDVNTLIVMGILNLETQPSTLFTKKRKFKISSSSPLDKETLGKLFKYNVEVSGNQDPTTIIKEKGEDAFVLAGPNKNSASVYRIPKKLEDLSEADQVKYRETINGSMVHVLPEWKKQFNGRPFIELEIKDLLDFKSKVGKYAKPHSLTKNSRPVIDLDDSDSYMTSVRNFSIDEVLSNEDLFDITRTDLHSAFQYFAKDRLFNLKMQETIDQLVGETGMRPIKLFTELERKTKEFIEKQDSIKDKKRRIRDVELGFTRLLWQIATWNGTASRNRLENKYTQYPTEIIGNTVNTISGPAWGLAQAPELTAELIASAMQTKGSSLVMGPFRGLLNLVKVWDRTDSSVKHDVADLLTSLEDFSTTYSSHFSDGFADIDFDSTGGIYRRIWDLEPEDESKLSSAANFARKTGQIAVIASGINDNTNLTRFYAKGRFIRLMREQIYSGKLKKFLQLRESSKAEMSALLADSYYNVSSERLLWKKHKSLARQAGLNPFLALQCVRCGLDTVESLETLVWGLNHIKAVDNKVDFRDLRLAHAELLEMNNPPVDPALYLKTITEFNVGIERMIRKKSVTSEYGLNKVLGDAERSSAHRWINKLTNYMRTWFDDRMLSIPETGVTKLVISSVITLGTLELAITLLREWIQGRAMEDIITEIEEDPWKYIIRFITRLPLFGTFSPMFEGLISFVAGATGVTSPRNKNTGLQQGLSASVMQLSVGGPAIGANVIQGGVRRIKDIGETYGLSVLGMPFNSSIYALPVRLLESRELFEKQSAMQFIIDGMQKKEYPYMERGRSSNTPKSGNVPIPAVDYPVSKLNMQDPKVKEMSYPGYKPNIEKPKQQPNTGVSGILGDLLKDLN